MPFVKLDCDMLTSTTWIDRPVREIFITALLMAEPGEAMTPLKQLEIRSLNETGWIVPTGWYGFVRAAGVGIARQAMVEGEDAIAALERLGAPEPNSRSQDHDGRRLVRIDGGFVILNYFKYRDRDYTNADRQRRYRRKKVLREGVTGDRYGNATSRIAEAEAEAYKDGGRGADAPTAQEKLNGKGRGSDKPIRRRFVPDGWEASEEMVKTMMTEGMTFEFIDRETTKFCEHEFDKPKSDWTKAWRNWLRRAQEMGRGAR